MSTGWPHDQVAPPGPDDEDSWPPAGGGRAASAERPAADQQPGDEPPGDQPSRGRSAGKPSRRERRGQADGRDRGARDGDEDYEWIQFLTGGRASAPDPADPPQQSSGAAALSPGASRDRAPYGADARAAGAPPGESRPSRPAHGLLGRRSPGAGPDYDQPHRSPADPRDAQSHRSPADPRDAQPISRFTPDTRRPDEPAAGRVRPAEPQFGRADPADDPSAGSRPSRPSHGLLGRRSHRAASEQDEPDEQEQPPSRPAGRRAAQGPTAERAAGQVPAAPFAPPDRPPAASRGGRVSHRRPSDPDQTAAWGADPGFRPPADSPRPGAAAPENGRRAGTRLPGSAEPGFGRQSEARPVPDADTDPGRRAGQRAPGDAGPSSGRRGRGRRGKDVSPEPPGPERQDPADDFRARTGPPRSRPDGSGSGQQTPPRPDSREPYPDGRAYGRQNDRPAPRDASAAYDSPADRPARPGAAWGLSAPPSAPRPAPTAAPAAAEAGWGEWTSPGFPRVDRQGFPTPLGEVQPGDGGAGFTSPAERGFPPGAGPVTGPRRAAVSPAQPVTGPHRAVTGPHHAVTGPHQAVTGPHNAASGPHRAVTVAGAAPGGWVARPGATVPADETPRDDLTNPDLAPRDGGARGRRPEAAAAASEAPAKRGRRDQKAPKVKSKRKTRDQDRDLVGAGETAAPTSAAPRAAPSDLGAAAAAETATATATSPSVAVSQRPVPRDTGAAEAPRRPGPGRAGRRTSRRRARRVYAAVGGVVVIAGAAVAFEMLQASAPSGPAHQISTPQRIGSYVQAPALAASMKASQVRRTIVTQSNGEASNVVAAVYESSASQPSPSASPGHGSTGPSSGSASPSTPGSAANSQIVLFIGGNLSGTSASSFITSFIGKLPGAVATAAGPLGGEAACVPSADGNPAECAWADNDTFGLVASPTLGAQALASELRQMRLQVEHRTHPR